MRVSSVDPLALGVYAFLHLGALGIFFVEFNLTAVAIFIATYLARIFGLSVVYHRYFAHRSFSVSRPTQFVFALIGILTMQRGPLWWAATHRTHHRFADTEHDLHSPHHQGVIYSHLLWFLDRKNRETDLSMVRDLARFPELRLADRPIFFLPVVAASAALLYDAFGATGIFWGFFASTVASHHATHCVQSLSHCWGGYRNFATGNDARNHLWLAWITLGEYHNNHHHRPGSARQGIRSWEIDPGWLLIRLMALLGIVTRTRHFSTREIDLAAAAPAIASTRDRQ